MQVFINETSLNNQYKEPFEFEAAILIFLSLVKKIIDVESSKEVYNSNNFYYFTGLKGTHIGTVLKNNPKLNESFVRNLQLLNPKKWESNKLHEEDSRYEFQGNNYVNTSVAELTERRLQDANLIGLLLNFSNSVFGNFSRIEIVKNGSQPISIDCAVDPEDIEYWLIDKKIIRLNEIYDEKCGIPPTDTQTVLRNKELFERTHYQKNHGRTVYRRIGTTQLWVVDNKHHGPEAHIEVFDENSRRHLGTSPYNKIEINTAFAKKDRRL